MPRIQDAIGVFVGSTPASAVFLGNTQVWQPTALDTAPATPGGLTATPGDTEVALTWGSSAGATGYRLYRDGAQVYDGAARALTDTGLTNGTAYSYTVSAYNDVGESAQSAAVVATPAVVLTYSDVVLADAPLAYYRLGEPSGTTAVDASANGNDGTYHNMALGTPGLLAGDADSAITGNGSNSYVDSPLALNPASGPFSVELWLKPASFANTRNIVGQRDGTGTGHSVLWAHQTTGVLAATLGGGVEYDSGAALAVGNVYHVVFTFDSGTYTFYVNGVAAGSGAATVDPATGGWVIGASKNLVNGPAGVMDEVAIYDKALTPEQVANHYTAGSGT